MELCIPLLGIPTPVSRTIIDAVFSAYTTSTSMDPTKVSRVRFNQAVHQQGRVQLTLECVTNKVKNNLLHQVRVDEQNTFLVLIEMNGELKVCRET